MSTEEFLALSAGLQAPARARAWVFAHTTQLSRAVRDDALLIASELVTNAVQHGAGEIAVRLRFAPDRLRIEVSDGGDGMPRPPASEPDLDRPTGRGLLIVASTAADWGVHRPTGDPAVVKTVWAELLLG